MPKYRHVTRATTIPVPGGKLIEELVGRVNTGSDDFSLAHMVAPPKWSEPPQTPKFGELTLVIRGRLEIEVDGEQVVVSAGEVLWVEPSVRVHYRNPFDEESEYYAFCMPAFAPDRARREE